MIAPVEPLAITISPASQADHECLNQELKRLMWNRLAAQRPADAVSRVASVTVASMLS